MYNLIMYLPLFYHAITSSFHQTTQIMVYNQNNPHAFVTIGEKATPLNVLTQKAYSFAPPTVGKLDGASKNQKSIPLSKSLFSFCFDSFHIPAHTKQLFSCVFVCAFRSRFSSKDNMQRDELPINTISQLIITAPPHTHISAHSDRLLSLFHRFLSSRSSSCCCERVYYDEQLHVLLFSIN